MRHCCDWLILWHGFHGCLCNQAQADVLSSWAGIKCLYCTLLTWPPRPMTFAKITFWALPISRHYFWTLLCLFTHRYTWIAVFQAIGIARARTTLVRVEASASMVRTPLTACVGQEAPERFVIKVSAVVIIFVLHTSFLCSMAHCSSKSSSIISINLLLYHLNILKTPMGESDC